MASDAIQKAGSVEIQKLELTTSTGVVIDLTEFLVELNIFEDMFAPTVYGNMVISDSRNIIEKGPVIGEETLELKVVTPGLPVAIANKFSVYKIDNRKIIRDNNTQVFALHFASFELFNDITKPLYKSYEGPIHEVVEEIFEEVRSETSGTELKIISETSNKVKFVACGWTPFKCLNWLASKAIPNDGEAKNFLFFENNQSFVWGSVETLFKEARDLGKYFVVAANIREDRKITNVNKEMFIAKDVNMIEAIDQVNFLTSGYLANRLLRLDLQEKEYEAIDYDYAEEYPNQFHSSGRGDSAVPPFNKSVGNPLTNISYYPVQPKLFNEFPDNINEKIGEIHGNRVSSLNDLTNIKLNITVPGRTDAMVGNMLYFSFPELGPRDNSSSAKEDTLYSGYYLITAIRHKISKIDHSMIMEIIKDSLKIGE